ncbi:hypothetical protein CI102_1216 [Trichoderma harzianum]|nr:hypothetical protein CI102_1216 [Trichoderma harzianum]
MRARSIALEAIEETAETAETASEASEIEEAAEIASEAAEIEEIAEAAEAAETAAAPEYYFEVPPPSALYDSYEDLLAFLQAFHREEGAALRTERSSNPQIINGERVLTYRALVCDCAGSHTSKSAGIRRSST